MDLPQLDVLSVPKGTDSDVIRAIALLASGDPDAPFVRLADVGLTVEQFRRILVVFTDAVVEFPSRAAIQRAWTDVSLSIASDLGTSHDRLASTHKVPLRRVEQALARVKTVRK